jgi:hypothetical protein
MKSARRGRSTSGAEVGNVSVHGFWLLVGDRERFLSFKDFPWFRDATIGQLINVELPSPHHLHWPDLDIDWRLNHWTIQGRYPLVSRAQPGKRLQPAAAVREKRAKYETSRRRHRGSARR